MNKRETGRGRAVNVDEMVIASCLLMAGLEGCQRMTCSHALPFAFVSPLLNMTSEVLDNCRRQINKNSIIY